MTARPPLSHIVDRARKLVAQREDRGAAQAQAAGMVDFATDVSLGDFWVRIGSRDRLIITRAHSAVAILHTADDDITIIEGYEDLLYEEVLPAIDRELILDDLAGI